MVQMLMYLLVGGGGGGGGDIMVVVVVEVRTSSSFLPQPVWCITWINTPVQSLVVVVLVVLKDLTVHNSGGDNWFKHQHLDQANGGGGGAKDNLWA